LEFSGSHHCIKMACCINGVYEKTFTKDCADFYVTCCPKELFSEETLAGMVGLKERFKLCMMGPGKMAWHGSMDNHPELSSFHIFHEGVEQHCNIPYMGGKTKVFYKKNAAGDGIISCMESDVMGKWEFEDKYTEEGLHRVLKKDGKTRKEFYKRVVHDNGFYKTTKLDGVEEFFRKDGFPEELICTLEDYKLCWQACDEGVKFVEWFGDLKVTTQAKFNEETVFKFPVEGAPDCKGVVAKIGVGKYTSVVKTPSGGTTEWTFKFCGNGLKLLARNCKTGDTCTMEMKKETPICGKWKPVTCEGVKELCGAIGVPAAEAEKFANDFDARLIVEEKGPIIGMKMINSVSPWETCFKYDQEYDFFDPAMQETCKNLTSRHGNVVTNISKSSKFTFITKCIFNTNFMVLKSHVEGLECMPMTVIYTRECCM